MNENVFFETKQKLSESDIARVETKYKILFPEDYRSHLLKYNGGYPERPCFSSPDTAHTDAYSPFSSCVHYFYAIYDGKVSNFEKNYENFKGRIPSNMIPIAYDPGGNQICLSTDVLNYGYVYFWSHEDESSNHIEDNNNRLTVLAKSFTEFVNGLHSEE